MICKLYEYFHCKKSSTIILQSSFHLSSSYNVSCNSSILNKYKKVLNIRRQLDYIYKTSELVKKYNIKKETDE